MRREGWAGRYGVVTLAIVLIIGLAGVAFSGPKGMRYLVNLNLEGQTTPNVVGVCMDFTGGDGALTIDSWNDTYSIMNNSFSGNNESIKTFEFRRVGKNDFIATLTNTRGSGGQGSARYAVYGRTHRRNTKIFGHILVVEGPGTFGGDISLATFEGVKVSASCVKNNDGTLKFSFN